jgi:sugar lactone lactonase YvrE
VRGRRRDRLYPPLGETLTCLSRSETCPTHVTFGGADLRTLYITTARFRLSPEAMAREPMAGGLLAAEVGVAGLPEPLFASGSDATPPSAAASAEGFLSA